jgi:hypothetical protein
MGGNEELKESLKRVRDALSGGKPLTADQRKQLENVLSDISRLFDGEEEHSHESLMQRLGDAADHFEDTHPDLTLAIGAMANVLSRMGI